MADMETKCLTQIYSRISGVCLWPTLDDFIDWSREQGYHTEMVLHKLNEAKPHGPDNSYWYKKMHAVEGVLCDFCKGCHKWTTRCEQAGCEAYRQWYVENWNKKIHRKVTIAPPVTAPAPKVSLGGRQFWQYEHPDRRK